MSWSAITTELPDARINERTLMGIPVQWNPRGNNARFPNILSKPHANSILEMENACPRCKLPFI